MPTRAAETSAGALSGIRVLDFTTVVSGPTCTQALGDLGADVVKVEPPSGDPCRMSGAPFREPGFSGFLAQFNRNKRSLVLDLKHPDARAVVLRLASDADVVAENWRPGVADRLGVGYDALCEVNPAVVYLSLNGFGSDGPYANLPAYDQVIQGMTGLMPEQGGPGEAPALVQGGVADKSSGMTATTAVLAALLARERSADGHGQHVEVAMIDAYAAFALPEAMMSRSFPPLEGDTASARAFFKTWETADGHVVGLIIQDHQYQALCRALEREDLARDERFVGALERFRNYAELVLIVAEEIRKHATAPLIERLRRHGAPFTPVNEVEDFLADPQVEHRRTVELSADDRFGEPTRYLAPPYRFERTPAAIRRHAPRLGEHTDELLGEAGFGDEEIAGLREKGVVR